MIPKKHQASSKRPSGVPREDPSKLQKHPRSSQDCLRRCPKSSTIHQETPRSVQGAPGKTYKLPKSIPGMPPETPRSTQKVPRRPQGDPKKPQRDAKLFATDSLLHYLRVPTSYPLLVRTLLDDSVSLMPPSLQTSVPASLPSSGAASLRVASAGSAKRKQLKISIFFGNCL